MPAAKGRCMSAAGSPDQISQHHGKPMALTPERSDPAELRVEEVARIEPAVLSEGVSEGEQVRKQVLKAGRKDTRTGPRIGHSQINRLPVGPCARVSSTRSPNP